MTETNISMIAAMTRNRVIGRKNDLPWHLPDDFQYFKNKTRGHHIIFGRKNYESLPDKFRPLPDRTNIIITRNQDLEIAGTVVMNDVKAAVELALKNGDPEPFIIGGGQIYKIGLSIANRIYLTEIDGEVEGDTYFPEFDHNSWREVSRVHHPKDERHKFPFDFVIYEKK